MLHNLVSIFPDLPTELEPEDLFSSALSTLYSDDCQVQHGDASSQLVYLSVHGELTFRCAEVDGEEERTKFAHYLWNAGILMAELLGGRLGRMTEARKEKIDFTDGKEWWLNPDEEGIWSINAENVLEVGAGTGLASIVSILAGAKEVTATDYPSEILLGTLKANIEKNTSSPLPLHVHVEPHLWGDMNSELARSCQHHFSRIIAADTLWMEGQHVNLAKSLAHFLAKTKSARTLIVAGFHTGRSKIAHFLQVIDQVELTIDTIVELDTISNRREWDPSRKGTPGEDKRWLVVAALKWKSCGFIDQ